MDQLTLYNKALRLCQEPRLATVDDDIEARYLLDQAYEDEDIRKTCLEQGQWNFAIEADKWSYDNTYTATFGWNRRFVKDTDCIRIVKVCSDERFMQPLLRYEDLAGYLYADLDDIYVQFVSKNASFGYNFALWPQLFTEFVAASLAMQIVPKLTQDENRIAKVEQAYQHWLTEARSVDAMKDPTKFPPSGAWSSARRGRWHGNDGGNTNSLIG